MHTKTCKACGVDKPLRQFQKNKLMKSGRLNKCKACRAHDKKLYYIDNRAVIRARENKGLPTDCLRFENIKKAHIKNTPLTAKCKKCSEVILKVEMILLNYGGTTKTKKYICKECFKDYRPHLRK